jgi:hypothetical protein
MASMLVVVLFWDSYRIAALCGVTLAYALIGVLALWRLSAHKKEEKAGVRRIARGTRARPRVACEPIRGTRMKAAGKAKARRARRRAIEQRPTTVRIAFQRPSGGRE